MLLLVVRVVVEVVTCRPRFLASGAIAETPLVEEIYGE